MISLKSDSVLFNSYSGLCQNPFITFHKHVKLKVQIPETLLSTEKL